MYVELHSASAFSFLEGASLPEELAARCAESGMPAMALLDRNGVYGAPRFHLAAKKCSVRAHIGAEITSTEYGVPSCEPEAPRHGGKYRIPNTWYAEKPTCHPERAGAELARQRRVEGPCVSLGTRYS